MHRRLPELRQSSACSRLKGDLAVQSAREVSDMETALTMFAVLVVWMILQVWVLPRLGVPT